MNIFSAKSDGPHCGIDIVISVKKSLAYDFDMLIIPTIMHYITLYVREKHYKTHTTCVIES